MSAQTAAPPTAAASNPKPALSGVKIRTRKSEKKATRYDPADFRDKLLKPIQEIVPHTQTGQLSEEILDKVSQTLDNLGNVLEYRRYADTLFDFLYAGAILAPGGSLADDGADRSPFYILKADKNFASVKIYSEIIIKVIRRFKYLQKSFEETTRKLLQYINRFDAEENEKLAMSLGYFAATGNLPLSVLNALFKDYLVKDGLALQFATSTFKAYLQEASIEHLGANLKRNGMETELFEFFPPNKRSDENFSRHFQQEGLASLVDLQKKRQANVIKDELITHLTEMISGNASTADVIAYCKQQITKADIAEIEIAKIVWDSIYKSLDLGAKPEQLEQQILKTINAHTRTLKTFCSASKTQLALILKAQVTCYEEAKLMKSFRSIVTLLYKADVVEENAILYWYEKGAAAQGKNVFTTQMEPFVKWLQEASEEESEEEDD